MVGRLSTESCKCNSFNLDRIFGNDTVPSHYLPVVIQFPGGFLAHSRGRYLPAGAPQCLNRSEMQDLLSCKIGFG